MFLEKKFYRVNREERNFGFLLFSSFIHDLNFRNGFIEILNSKCEGNLFEPFEEIDVYAEVALFRDHWYELGDQKKYTDALHQSRKVIVEQLLHLSGLDTNLINNYDFFWTGEIGKSKLWYPGKWDISKMKFAQDSENLTQNEILRMRWAFNAKPDILLISNRSAIFIELKIESGIGDSSEGYNQEQTQFDIMRFSHALIPEFNGLRIERIMITQNEPGSVKWSEFNALYSNELVKKYMINIPKEKSLLNKS